MAITNTTRPPRSVSDEHQRLREACHPMPVNWFRAIKATFYTAVMLVVVHLALQAEANATLVFLGFLTFIIVFITEVKEVQLAGISATFFRSGGDDDD